MEAQPSKSQIEMRDDDDEQEALDQLVQPNANITTGTKQAEEMSTELSVDEVLEGHVGSFGLAQVLQVFLVSLAWIFDSQNTLVTIFTDAQPATWRCLTPEQYGSAVPIPLGLCSGPASKRDAASVCGLPEGAWEWIGGHKSSIIAEWGLVCDHKFLAAVPASLFFLGSLLGSAFYGKLADSILGRKRTVLLSCILCSVTALATSFSPNIWAYAFFRFSNGFARSGIGICCLVLSTEAVGRKWRGQVGQYGFFFFTVGFLSLPLLAYPTRANWRNLYKIISALPIAYTFLLVPLVSESPRWLLVKGRDREALDVLKKLAKINGKRLPANLKLSNPSAPKEGDGEHKNEKLWTTKWAAKRMVLVMIAGFGVGFVYYGIQLNAENLNFNLYFSVALNAIMEIPAVFIGSVMLSYMNRRIIFSLSAAVAGAASMLCIIFSRGGEHASKDKKSGGSWPQLTIEAAGFMAASTAFDVLYIYCVELFPTNVRNFAVSQLRQALMLGASLAPMLVVLGRMSPAISFLVFGVLSFCSGVLSLWLPETRNAPLYETLKQQEEEEKVIHRTAESSLEPGTAK